MAELRRTQIERVVKSKGIFKAPSAAAIRQLTSNRGSQLDLGDDFKEGGKPEEPEKNPRSTESQLQQLYTHISFNFENQHRPMPRWSPMQSMTSADPRLNLGLSGERQRVNRMSY